MTSISAISGSGATASANSASQITALRKQEAVLTQKIKDVATSSADAKSKQTQTDSLNAQIQLIEVQIARLEQQQAADAAQKVDATAKVTDAAKPGASASAQRSLDGAGNTVDVEA